MIAYAAHKLDEAAPRLLEGWTSLVAKSGLNPSLAPGWVNVAVSALSQPESPMTVLTGADVNGRIEAVMPFYFSRVKMLGIPLRQLELGSNLMSYHAEVVAPGRCDEALGALLEHDQTWDVFRASNILLGSETATCIERIARQRGAHLQMLRGEESPYLAIDRPWQDFLATQNKKFRYKWRKRKEAIESSADLALKWFAREEGVAELLSDVLAIEQSSWKASAGSTIASHDNELRYHQALLPYLARQGLLLANVLYRAGRPIAYSVCCNHLGWVGHLKTSFDEAHKDLSPGAFVIDASVEWAFESGAKEFDFLGAAAPHKLAWTSTVRPHADFFLFSRKLKSRAVTILKNLAKRVSSQKER